MPEIVSLQDLKVRAIGDIEKFKTYKDYIAVENGWWVSCNFNISGITGGLCYTFIKPLLQPIYIKFSGKGGKWEGWIHTLYYMDGFTQCNMKDIHLMTLQFSCHARIIEAKYDFMPIGYYSGWHRGLTKSDMSKFRGIVDLNLLPDIGDKVRYMTMNDELKSFKEEEYINNYKLSEDRKKQIRLRQLEIFNEIISKL
jgi:hypothetical protein